MKLSGILKKINDEIIGKECITSEEMLDFKYNKCPANEFRRTSVSEELKCRSPRKSVTWAPVLVRKTEEDKICRICRLSSDKTKEELISPCACKGTLAYIHRSCLEKWLKRSGTSCCELCRFNYTVRIIERYSKVDSIRKWLTDEENFSDAQDLIVDGVLAVTFLPIVFICCYGFATVYSESPSINAIFSFSRNSFEMKQKLSVVLMLGCVTMFIVACYSCWLALRSAHYHKKWNSWVRRHGKLLLILDKKKNV